MNSPWPFPASARASQRQHRSSPSPSTIRKGPNTRASSPAPHGNTRWVNRSNTRRHYFDLLDINYVYLPESTNDFLDQIAPDNPLLRYSYEDHFIMSMGYRYYNTNKRIPSSLLKTYTLQPTVYTIRASVETAGNLLYAISSLSDVRRRNGAYRVFGINYSQYVKSEIDYSLTRNINPRHSLAFHVGAGIGIPYGNSTVLPFEKRFYAGGANGVKRLGELRTLGPGRLRLAQLRDRLHKPVRRYPSRPQPRIPRKTLLGARRGRFRRRRQHLDNTQLREPARRHVPFGRLSGSRSPSLTDFSAFDSTSPTFSCASTLASRPTILLWVRKDGLILHPNSASGRHIPLRRRLSPY